MPSFTKSLQYGFIIALVYPLGPFICSLFADKIERKWQIVSAALGTATFGLIFARMSEPLLMVILGSSVLIVRRRTVWLSLRRKLQPF